MRLKLPVECLSTQYPMAILWNVYDIEEASLHPTFFSELEDDLREELKKFGSIISLFCPLHSHLNGVVIVIYYSYESVQQCLDSLKDRIFDGRKIYSQLLNPIESIITQEQKIQNETLIDRGIIASNNSVVVVVEKDEKKIEEDNLDPSILEAVQDVEDFLNSLL